MGSYKSTGNNTYCIYYIQNVEEMKAVDNMMLKHDFEIMFNDSPEYFLVKNAKMIFEKGMVRFICFKDDKFKENIWYPMSNISRIKRYTW